MNDPVNRQAYKGKRVGIMQPYFFPYIGYFGLIAHSDRWIVFDPVQYIRKGWMNRNRVLKGGGGEKYVSITVAPHERSTLISDIHLAPEQDRFNHFVRQLDAYKLLRAPYYSVVTELLRSCFETSTDKLVPFLTKSLQHTCEYIGIPFQHEIYSEMQLTHAEPSHPMEWSLFTCEELGAAEYLNPPGGRSFFDPERFRQSGIRLLFHEQRLTEYNQHGPQFIPGLSIIDVMMFNSPLEIRAMLDQFTLSEE